MTASPQNIQERTFAYACRIVKLHDVLRERKVAPRLLNQLVGSGTAIGANMQEAQGAESKADFIHKCNIAIKEVRETHFWLRLIAANKYVQPEQLEPILNKTNEIISILVAIVKKTRQGMK